MECPLDKLYKLFGCCFEKTRLTEKGRVHRKNEWKKNWRWNKIQPRRRVQCLRFGSLTILCWKSNRWDLNEPANNVCSGSNTWKIWDRKHNEEKKTWQNWATIWISLFFGRKKLPSRNFFLVHIRMAAAHKFALIAWVPKNTWDIVFHVWNGYQSGFPTQWLSGFFFDIADARGGWLMLQCRTYT